LREIKQQEYERQREAAFFRVRRSENPRRMRTIRVLSDDADPDWAVTEPDTKAPPTDRPHLEGCSHQLVRIQLFV
jgi:hypothetical protein